MKDMLKEISRVKGILLPFLIPVGALYLASFITHIIPSGSWMLFPTVILSFLGVCMAVLLALFLAERAHDNLDE